jgi:hypothetical protein
MNGPYPALGSERKLFPEDIVWRLPLIKKTANESKHQQSKHVSLKRRGSPLTVRMSAKLLRAQTWAMLGAGARVIACLALAGRERPRGAPLAAPAA